ncbi:tyrosine-type recombinase/integrase [Stutzerimonas stutzeri]|uniref:tyrosine-type recombinase/integrase n=1 Tax=Stutzerimonas stutzeri TaxID=316 RepID=UPI001EED2E56|nr:tyrosine-type recombinase/integrase [Stutzerimonas stutzeri]
MSRLYRWAKRELLIDIANPLADIALPQASKSSDKVVSKGELFLVLEHLSPAMKLITELAYETAMRRSEIVKLTIEHVHLEERIADVVDGKNGTRSVPLTKRAVELLQEAIRLAKSKRIPTGRLFNITPHSVSTAVRRARQIDTDRYALGHLIQFIFRGSIRKHEDMHLLITSLRMKSLLENWLEN